MVLVVFFVDCIAKLRQWMVLKKDGTARPGTETLF